MLRKSLKTNHNNKTYEGFITMHKTRIIISNNSAWNVCISPGDRYFNSHLNKYLQNSMRIPGYIIFILFEDLKRNDYVREQISCDRSLKAQTQC